MFYLLQGPGNGAYPRRMAPYPSPMQGMQSMQGMQGMQAMHMNSKQRGMYGGPPHHVQNFPPGSPANPGQVCNHLITTIIVHYDTEEMYQNIQELSHQK